MPELDGRLRGAGLVMLLCALVLTAVAPSPAAAAPHQCPASFRVLHDDRIGKLRLPAGDYTITVLERGTLGCKRAARLFTRFLEDFDGNLPGAWRLRPKRSAFVNVRSGAGFSVAKGKSSGGGGGKHPAGGGKRCPASFRVLHDDRIGKLRIPAGRYSLTRLTSNSPNCRRISRLFTKFLQDYQGKIPGWRVAPGRGAFIKRGGGGKGFRIKRI